MKEVFAGYNNREGKARFITDHFEKNLKQANSILDIGCDNNRFKSTHGSKVTGIDIAGSPDYIVNLEKEKLSHFPDNSFELIICTDVLEHIDNFHAVLDDMFRVSRDKIIISLPNCGSFFRAMPIIFGRHSGKYYGLPLTPPEDRHKWFFTWREIRSFFHNYATKNKLDIENEFLSYGYKSPLRRSILQTISFILPVTTFAQSYWVVLTPNSTSKNTPQTTNN